MITKITRFTTVFNALMIIPLLSGCSFTRWEYSRGITRYEGFKEPTRVLVSRTDGSIAIEVESFIYSPAEASKYYDKSPPRRPFWKRIPDRVMRRRFLIATAEKMDKIIAHESSSASHDTEPHDALHVSIYLLPLQAQNERSIHDSHWNVIPSNFDAPSVSDSDLPNFFAGGYEAYPWQKHVAREFPDHSSHYYYAWKNPVPWKSQDGRHWRLSFTLMAYPRVARFERPHNGLDRYKPLFWIADIITCPIQVVAAPIIFALTAGPS